MYSIYCTDTHTLIHNEQRLAYLPSGLPESITVVVGCRMECEEDIGDGGNGRVRRPCFGGAEGEGKKGDIDEPESLGD